MRRAYVLTAEARSDLKEILLGIADVDENAALRIQSEFDEAFRVVARNPGIGHYRTDLLDRRYRFWTCYSWVICYRWERNPLRIVAIIHGARELGAIFPSRFSSEVV